MTKKHECIHEEEFADVKDMQKQISNVDKNVAVIVTKMETRDEQRKKDQRMYKEGIKKMQDEIGANTKFRTEAKSIIGFVIMIATLLGGAALWLANKLWPFN